MNAKPWRVALGAEAEKDFVRILTYTLATFGPNQAEIYESTILDAIRALEFGPDAPGSLVRDDLRPGLRSLHVARRGRRGRHLLIYRAGKGSMIEVLRILHDAMDLSRHIPSDPD